ncbi:Smr/MutS family protein [Alphaproteobacteria bacterium]|nr:Smr/MutS family protein [Alphaproteobacteria bacterium]
MQKDNKNSTISKDDELWDNVTKNDKKYVKSNRFITKNLNAIEKTLKTKNNNKPTMPNNEFIKENIKNDIITIKKSINIQELDPRKIPSGISASQADKLKKGKIRPEITLDLHGFTQFRAHSYINKEILKCYKNNMRSILIITGKKLGKMGAEGVLKREVPKWLNLSPLKEIILMTSWATPRDGGEGALYVLLRRVR